ncbi:STN domain-containing protein, partial [Winogradskyella poriferorum]|uniref:STN domain-containing protein n=1 Tax=Winogradskyella poriferorum TaxID=307627 RepID=UPI003D64AE31
MEQQSGYTFFYLDDWLKGIAVPGNLEGLELTDALDVILEGTTLNYYMLDTEKRVFLLQNGIIYDELPNGFFGQT